MGGVAEPSFGYQQIAWIVRVHHGIDTVDSVLSRLSLTIGGAWIVKVSHDTADSVRPRLLLRMDGDPKNATSLSPMSKGVTDLISEKQQ